MLAACGRPDGRDAYLRRPDSTLTFAADIAAIVYSRCASCHRPGGSASFSLLTYQDVKYRASLVAAVTANRVMPPWLPEPGRGDFANARRLSADEIGMIGQWVEEGAREGDSTKLPPAPGWADEWSLGPPDLVVTVPEPYVLPARGPEVFRNFVIPVHFPGPRWVKAVELRPGDARAVHHAMIMVDTTSLSRELDEQDPGLGYGGMHPIGNARMPPGFFLGWTPGRVPTSGTDGLSWELQDGSDLVLMLHLRPGAAEVRIAPTVGLYFADRPPGRFPTTIRLGSETIDIPPGATNYAVRDSFVLPVDIDVLGVYPHAHYHGKDIRATATLPDGSTRWLLHIPRWDFNWQDEYAYASPIRLPRGTTLTMQITYDNAGQGSGDAHGAAGHVAFGPRSTDEMGDLWLRVLPRDSTDLAILHRELGVKGLERRLSGLEQAIRLHPGEAGPHDQLAGLLLSFGRVDEAIAHYRQALAADPDDGNAHYNLAVALQGRGRLDEAIDHYRHAVRVTPSNASAYNNLGNALVARGAVVDAVVAYRWAILIAPSYAEAHNNLGVTLVARREVAEGLRHSREAARLKPDWATPLAAMAWTLATYPDDRVRRPGEAVRLAERAAALTGRRDAAALNALAAAYAAAGDFGRAVPMAEEALALAAASGDAATARDIGALIARYKQDRPYRDSAGALGARP
ncbi:MAG: tetratricopeptide repeat protein [Gemmatimonadota bacterium]